MGQYRRNSLGLVAMLALLPGCLMKGDDGSGHLVTRFLGGGAHTDAVVDETPAAMPVAEAEPSSLERVKEAEGSFVISSLQARRSVIPVGSSYAAVSDAVMSADARVAAAELQAAQLRARAANKNWLPTIGPSISLSSLGDFVADLVVQQVLFDNGRKKAERDLARADVERAAVTLVEDGNDRVSEGLRLYLAAEEAREAETRARKTLKDMQHFEWVMSERVRGGVSDLSDLNVIRQKITEIKARIAAAEERRRTALAELSAMSSAPVNGGGGIETLASVPPEAQPLGILRAEVEKDIDLANARIERASHLPGLSAGGTTGDSGDNLGLSITSDKLLGLGTADSLAAIKLVEETADRRVAQAREDSNRTVVSLREQLSALARQAEEAKVITAQAKANLDLFQKQYKAGQRQVTDVVGVYETFARQEQLGIELRYKRARAELEIAREMGVLVNGDAL